MLQPINFNTPLRFGAGLPKAVDVAIIGGGIIGICSAIYLSRMGRSVLVCEKGRIACEQSSRNWGWIRMLGRDRGEYPIMMEASRLWEALDRDTGGKTGFRREGIMYLASEEKTAEKNERYLSDGRDFGVRMAVLGSAEIASKIKAGEGGKKWLSAIFSPDDARAEPWLAVPALSEFANENGVHIREHCGVRALDVVAGKITGIFTEKGKVKAEQVIVAAGAWSSLFLKRHGISVPQLSVRSTVSSTQILPNFYEGGAADEELAFRRRLDGSYTISASDAHDLYLGPDAFRHAIKYLPTVRHSLGQTRFHLSAPAVFWPDGWATRRFWAEDETSPFEINRILNPEPDRQRVQKVRERFAARFPQIGKPEIACSWAGMIDTFPDVVPLVDQVPSHEGLIVATGMSGHGFGIGPGFGKIVAHLAAGKAIEHDLSRFRFSRFSDGSKIVPGPGM